MADLRITGLPDGAYGGSKFVMMDRVDLASAEKLTWDDVLTSFNASIQSAMVFSPHTWVRAQVVEPQFGEIGIQVIAFDASTVTLEVQGFGADLPSFAVRDLGNALALTFGVYGSGRLFVNQLEHTPVNVLNELGRFPIYANDGITIVGYVPFYWEPT